MRGTDHQTGHLCGYVNPEVMVPSDHPLRSIRPLVDAALECVQRGGSAGPGGQRQAG
jgi:hypothetical protein